MDMWHKVCKWLDHNRYTALGLAIALALIVGVAGCQARTISPVTGEKVSETRFRADVADGKAALEAEKAAVEARIKAFNARVRAGKDDINQQKARLASIVETVGAVGTAAVEGTISPAAGVGAGVVVLSGLLGVGVKADNKRKDGLLAKQ